MWFGKDKGFSLDRVWFDVMLAKWSEKYIKASRWVGNGK